jgi:hypothetical protein
VTFEHTLDNQMLYAEVTGDYRNSAMRRKNSAKRAWRSPPYRRRHRGGRWAVLAANER